LIHAASSADARPSPSSSVASVPAGASIFLTNCGAGSLPPAMAQPMQSAITNLIADTASAGMSS